MKFANGALWTVYETETGKIVSFGSAESPEMRERRRLRLGPELKMIFDSAADGRTHEVDVETGKIRKRPEMARKSAQRSRR